MKKRISVLFAVVLLLVVMTACSNNGGSNGGSTASSTPNTESANPTPSESTDEIFIPIISKGFQHQFWQAVKNGADQAAAEFGVKITFEGPETEAQIDKQIEMLQAAIDKNPSAVGFAALDSQAATPLLQKLADKNIPVIAFDSGVESNIPVTTATTDNVAAAALAADKMAELIGGEGEIAVISHSQTSKTGIDRTEGFIKQIEANHPNIKVVDIQYGDGDHLKSTDLTKAIMQAYPNLIGIFGTNEGSAIGVVNAVTELKKEGSVVVVGFDSGKAQIDAIKSGLMAGAITQNPVGIGYETVKAAVAALKGETLPETIDTGFYWYDSTNVDSAEIQAVIYE